MKKKTLFGIIAATLLLAAAALGIAALGGAFETAPEGENLDQPQAATGPNTAIEIEPLDANSIEGKAQAKAIELFGKEEVAKYTLINRYGQEGDLQFAVFAQLLGENNYIHGPQLLFAYTSEGRFVTYTLSRSEGFAEFDQARLKPYTKAVVDQMVQEEYDKNAEKALYLKDTTYAVTDYLLTYEDGTYYIQTELELLYTHPYTHKTATYNRSFRFPID